MAELLAELPLQQQHPVLLTGCVEIVRTGLQRRLDHRQPQLHERPHHIDDDLAPGEQGQQVGVLVPHAHATVVVAFQFRNQRHLRLQACLVAPGRNEGNAGGGQFPGNQLAGVAACAIDDDLVLIGIHFVSPENQWRA